MLCKYSFYLLLGIIILPSCQPGKKSQVPKKPTFTEHIAPIIYKHCINCHRDGGVGPFSLLTYSKVKSKARTIARVTRIKYMPPWPADPSYTHFTGENYLSNDEIETIQNWYKTGAPEGLKEKLPVYKVPTWKSMIGKPDMVLPLDSVLLFPNMKDRFYIIKIPGLLAADTWLRAIEFVAGNQDLVHHFNGHLLLYNWNEKKDPAAGKQKMEVTQGEYKEDFKQLGLFNDDGSIPNRIHSAVNYLPGVLGTAYPDGLGTLRLSRKFAFVGNDLHYGPSDRLIVDRSYINLFFTNKPPSRPLAEIMLGTNGISKIEPPLQIEANKIQTHRTQFTVPKDISIVTINPHLHLLGKSFFAFAIKPNGDTVRLIRIPQWDFRWQYFYTFKTMVHLPAGSVIIAEAVFDNTTSNPNNPNNPPKQVGERLQFGGASMRATDEMFQFIVTYTMYRKGDETLSLEVTKK
jgi:hypothetical protein